MRAEHAPEERLVSPNPWPSLSLHVAASPGSHAALEVGGVSVRSFGEGNADALVALLQGSAFAAPALSLLVLCGTPCACRNHGRHGWTSAALAADGPRQSDAVRA